MIAVRGQVSRTPRPAADSSGGAGEGAVVRNESPHPFQPPDRIEAVLNGLDPDAPASQRMLRENRTLLHASGFVSDSHHRSVGVAEQQDAVVFADQAVQFGGIGDVAQAQILDG